MFKYKPIITDIALAMSNFAYYPFNGNAMSVYVNGNKTGEKIYSGPISPLTNNLRIGERNAPELVNSLFNGIINDIRIYNRALSQSEITELYTLKNPNAPLAPSCTTNAATNITVNSSTFINISSGLYGNSDSNASVNIVDALHITRYSVD